MTPMEFFQNAIDATDKNDYLLALRYYEAFRAKYPEDLPNNLWAAYEIAFCRYKMGQNSLAIELFQALLEQYQELESSEDADKKAIPQGPKILAEKVLEKITPKEEQATEEG